MRTAWISLLLVVVLVVAAVSVPTVVLAATSDTVAINATPSFITISNSPNNYGFGSVVVSTNTSTAQNYFTITNGSSVNIDIAISANATWAGGNTWTHSDAGTPGSTTAALYADDDTGDFTIIVKNATPNDLYTNTADASPDWGLRLLSPTVYDDGVLKTTTVTLTASEA